MIDAEAIRGSATPSLRARLLVAALDVARPPMNLLPAWRPVLDAMDLAAGTVGWTARGRVRVTHVRPGGVSAELVLSRRVTKPERIVLLLHGGGFAFGSPASHRALAESLSVSCAAEVLVPDFRQVPSATVAEMVADCLAVYRALAETHDPARIVVCGDSSGANLAFGTLLAARDEGLPLAAGMVGLAGWLDLATDPPDDHRDPLIAVRFARRLARFSQIDGAPAPALSPLDRDVSGLPPVLLQCGLEDPLRGGNERMQRHLASYGVPCELQIWTGPMHDFQILGRLLPESRAAIAETGVFARSVTAEQPATQRRRFTMRRTGS